MKFLEFEKLKVLLRNFLENEPKQEGSLLKKIMKIKKNKKGKQNIK